MRSAGRRGIQPLRVRERIPLRPDESHIDQFDFNRADFFKHQPQRRELPERLYESGATEDGFIKANLEIAKPNGKV
jgi:hypothetical protein